MHEGRSSVALLTLVAITAGSALIGGPLGLSVADPLLGVAFVLVLLPTLLLKPGYGYEVGPEIRQLIAPLSLWSATMLIHALMPQPSSSEALQLVKNLAGPAFLVVCLGLRAIGPRRAPWFDGAILTVTIIISATVLVSPASRPSGIFPNPIHSATWLGAALLYVVVLGRLNRYLKIIAALGILAAVFQTGSFAVYLALALSFIYLQLSRRTVKTVTMISLGTAGTIFLGLGTFSRTIDPLNRAAASQSSRLDVWSQAWATWLNNPFGIGPGAFSERLIAPILGTGLGYETHNDYLGVLVEGGLVGLFAVLWLVRRLWRMTETPARVILVFFAASAVFHNVLNFRHLWIFLALALGMQVIGRTVRDPCVPCDRRGESGLPLAGRGAHA